MRSDGIPPLGPPPTGPPQGTRAEKSPTVGRVRSDLTERLPSNPQDAASSFGTLNCIHGKILLVESEEERRRCRERSRVVVVLKQFKICCGGPEICMNLKQLSKSSLLESGAV